MRSSLVHVCPPVNEEAIFTRPFTTKVRYYRSVLLNEQRTRATCSNQSQQTMTLLARNFALLAMVTCCGFQL